MQFLAHDHNANYEAALKIKETIAQNHDIKSAYIEVGEKCVIRSNRTCWNDIRRIDEFGIESPLTEELTSKQVSDLNLNIAKNNYEASIDEHTGNVVFAEGVTEKEKLEFAVWLFLFRQPFQNSLSFLYLFYLLCNLLGGVILAQRIGSCELLLSLAR